MGLITKFRNLEPRLRVMLIATGCLIIPQIGQILAIASINQTGQVSGLAFALQFAGIFFVSTSVILSAVIMYTLRHQWRAHLPVMLLGALNICLSLNLVWSFFDPCGWTQLVLSLTLPSCTN